MASEIKPLHLFGFGRTANPTKVAFMLEELDLTWTNVPVSLEDVKKPDYTAINPNGRLPALHDPNNDLTIWESGAILEYLTDTYDTHRKLSFPPDTREYWHARQWLYFQVSGQGPYYGQLGWYKLFEKETNQSAIDRYTSEANRVSGVLDAWLAKQKAENPDTDGPWLVGNKYSYADLAFVPWQFVMSLALKDVYEQKKYPTLNEWYEKITSRKAIKEVLERSAKTSESH